jgi:hypothetical protein
MATIASLDVLVGANTSMFTKNMGALKGVAQGSLKSVAGVAVGIGKTLAGAVVSAVGAGLVAYQAVETANKKLQANLIATGQAAGVSATTVRDMALSMSTTTTASANAITTASIALTKFQNVKGPNFTETIKQAQNLSAVTGKDLTASTDMLGHALNNPRLGYLELAKAGVMFTDGQIDSIQAMQDAGDIAGAQQVILQQLASQYEVAASVAGDTFTGKLEMLWNSLSNVASVIGEAIIPSLTKGLDWILEWVKSINLMAVKVGVFESFRVVCLAVADAVQLISLTFNTMKLGLHAAVLVGIKGFIALADMCEMAMNKVAKFLGMNRELAKDDGSLAGIKKFASAYEQEVVGMADNLRDDWKKPWAHNAPVVKNFFQEVRDESTKTAAITTNAANKMAEAIKNGPVGALKMLTEKQMAAQDEAIKLIDSLRLENKFHGMDDRQKKVAELGERGATNGQVEEIQKLSHMLRGKELTAEFATPLEKFEKEMKKLDAVYQAGGLDQRTYERARGKMITDLQGATPQNKVSAGGAIMARSQEARSALLAYHGAVRSADPQVAMQKIAEKELEESKEQTKYLRLLVKGNPSIEQFAGI